ncbi:hypothetical protein C9F11_08965 [Streptomyces sp. YIM 121038]|uniref:hypothetical protein n=1 Tax=Streptomyces sp. YIM 121038 TaxID=2136401 RepID=UPI001110F20B|nr:hypothetical protein [Streptomyces sp. YIM 121038]QCX75482.1 hypothetical protein C9F11_08965 [Streptomyces sp. YIM 121038]
MYDPTPTWTFQDAHAELHAHRAWVSGWGVTCDCHIGTDLLIHQGPDCAHLVEHVLPTGDADEGEVPPAWARKIMSALGVAA